MLKIRQIENAKLQTYSLHLDFEAAIKGRCLLEFSTAGIHSFQIISISQGDGMKASRSELNWIGDRRLNGDLPEWFFDFLDSFQNYIKGGEHDFSRVPLVAAKPMSEFAMSVYDVTSFVRPGETITYGEVALQLELPMSARAVGAALGRNPWPLIVPCHRIMGAGQRLTGFSAPGGVNTKALLLDFERIFQDQRGMFDEHLVSPLHA